jgi:hypothetical protein
LLDRQIGFAGFGRWNGWDMTRHRGGHLGVVLIEYVLYVSHPLDLVGKFLFDDVSLRPETRQTMARRNNMLFMRKIKSKRQNDKRMYKCDRTNFLKCQIPHHRAGKRLVGQRKHAKGQRRNLSKRRGLNRVERAPGKQGSYCQAAR